jgi:hypothetical protein
MSAFLASCESIDTPLDDGYQFGDLSRTAIQLQAEYCAEADPRQRALLLALIKRTHIPIPDRGACTDLLNLLPEFELPDVDFDAAEEDMERYSK